ncbi:MAG: hypothetical protein L3J83_03185 [Proteobacteria bacterium]|nr:hypothetical protein [Pseudomonadota bacterium]
MKHLLLFIVIIFSTNSYALNDWLKNLDAPDKQQQLEFRWKAFGGEADLRFMYEKLSLNKITVNPAPEFPKKHWSSNHLIFPIKKSSALEMQVPYGIITKITNGHLLIITDVSLSHKNTTLNISSLKLQPTAIFNKGDIVNFVLVDNNNNELFTASSIHLEFDLDKKLMRMSNIDLIATQTLAKLLKSPHIAGEVIAQLHVYNKLVIPEDAKTTLKAIEAISCTSTPPIWPPAGIVDVTLLNVGQLTHVGSVTPEKIIIAPSASLKNIGTADVAWYWKFRGSFPPYNNDQHPYLSWSIYREINGRFEQIGLSGVKHAFFTVNTSCACPGGQILGLECEDVYGVGNNDADRDLGPRQEVDSFSGIWEGCGSFFDPDCTGSLQNQSTGLGENRLIADTGELTDANNSQLFFQAWYIIRDDIDIFNSMGYRSFAPAPNGGGGWAMNEDAVFTNGAALDNYVTPNTISALESSQTQSTSEGHFTVAVKVVDLGNDLYRYNYAIENYDFDPRFNQFTLPLIDSPLITDWVFSDSDDNASNDWTVNFSNGRVHVMGDNTNEQDWGMLFSFSFTAPTPPTQGVISLNVANPVLNNTVTSTVLVPDLSNFNIIFKSSFED